MGLHKKIFTKKEVNEINSKIDRFLEKTTENMQERQ